MITVVTRIVEAKGWNIYQDHEMVKQELYNGKFACILEDHKRLSDIV